MNAQPKPLVGEVLDDPSELAVIPSETALAVLTDPERFDAFLADVRAQVDAHVPDVTTAKGREAIKSLAFKVTKSKTAIDAAGKALTEEWRSKTQVVDAARRKIREKLDALRDEARRPVTEWEVAEEARADEAKALLERLRSAVLIGFGDTAETIGERLIDLQKLQLDDDRLQEYAAAAKALHATAVTALEAAVARLNQEAADRAELARLRQAEEERVAREKEAQAAAKAAEEAAAEAAAAEQRRADEVKAAQEREARAAEEAAAAARAEAEAEAQAARDAAAAQAKAEQEKREAAHREALMRADEARLAAEAEAKRLADQKAAEELAAAEERQAAEARAADIAHRSTIMAAAKTALMGAGGIGEDAAKKIVLAIKAGEIPSVSIRF